MFQTRADNRPRTLRRPAATRKTRSLVVDIVFALVAVALFLALTNTGILVSFADWFGQMVAANWR